MSTSPEGGPPERCAKQENIFITHTKSAPQRSQLLKPSRSGAACATEEGAGDTGDGAQDIFGPRHFIDEAALVPFSLTCAETSEHLRLLVALANYSHIRFIVNLLPLLQQAPALRRVVVVFAGGKEGPIDSSDFQGRRVPFLSARGHLCSIITLAWKRWQQRLRM